MRKKIVYIIVLSLFLMPLVGCKTEQKLYSGQFFEYFDTITQVRGYAESQEAFQETFDYVKEEIGTYHKFFDIYNTYDNIINLKTLNDHAGNGPQEVDQKIIDLLLFSQDMYALSHGKINVAYGAVLSIWHDLRTQGRDFPDEARLPELSELQEAATHTNIEDLVIDAEKRTVELRDPEMRLDVGALAKGYAAERVAESLKARGEEHFLLSVGGNVRAIGARDARGTPWKIGIDNPIHRDREEKPYVTTIGVTEDLSIVSSGLYERFYRVDGEIYHHIIDPETLFPKNRYLSLSVFTEDSGLADALSTYLYNTDLEEGLAYVERTEGLEALWVLMDQSEVRSSGVEVLEKAGS